MRTPARSTWVGGVENGKDAIRKAMSGFGGGRHVDIPEGATSRPRTHHQIINHVIDVNCLPDGVGWLELAAAHSVRLRP